MRRADRGLVALVGVRNSYKHAALLGAGIAAHISVPEWVAVVVSNDPRARTVPLPRGVVEVLVEDLESLPSIHPEVKVVIAPPPASPPPATTSSATTR